MAHATRTGKGLAGGRPVAGGVPRCAPGAPHSGTRERGFTLAAVVIMMAVMAVFLGVAVQTATFQRQRENEAELIFRGEQMVEGIRLFRARFGRFPLSLDELFKAKPRCMRKKWVDPITGKDDWVPVFLGQEGNPVAGDPNRGLPQPTPQPTPTFGGGDPSRQARGPIVGVHSRSCDKSIKVVDGRTRYCDWKFVYDPRKLKGNTTTPPQPTPPGRR